ncbi:uncharacterized protein LOC126835602 [Adelges cooleyi]|uniref:uncharacterized protein LOC126835602 n=1 Tax=Adelges cooleyi TaxID=133065 RepID=UPI00217FFB38|nr:uncharacterized protein LOC126835602 [Adelges cooleyi]
MSFDAVKLINEVKRRRSLWDTSHCDYANKIITQDSWNGVCRNFKEGFDSMETKENDKYLQYLQRKWKNLKISYAREQSKRMTLKSGSGSKPWTTYMYYNQLSFLSTCVRNKQTTSNLNDNDAEPTIKNEDNDSMNDSGEEHSYKETITRSRSSKKQKTQPKDTEGQLFLPLQKSVEEDPDRLFLLSLIDDFKQVPEDKKLDVKLSIMRIISNAKQSLQPNNSQNLTQQKTPFSVVSNVDTQCQLDPSYNVHSPTRDQNPCSGVYQSQNHQKNDQPKRFQTPTSTPSENIPIHSDLDASQSRSSSLNAPELIYLKVLGQDNTVVQFKIKKRSPLTKLMNAYCERTGLAIATVIFKFGDKVISESDTPLSLEMEEGQTIEQFIKQ